MEFARAIVYSNPIISAYPRYKYVFLNKLLCVVYYLEIGKLHSLNNNLANQFLLIFIHLDSHAMKKLMVLLETPKVNWI